MKFWTSVDIQLRVQNNVFSSWSVSVCVRSECGEQLFSLSDIDTEWSACAKSVQEWRAVDWRGTQEPSWRRCQKPVRTRLRQQRPRQWVSFYAFARPDCRPAEACSGVVRSSVKSWFVNRIFWKLILMHASWHLNRFIRFQNIVFTSFVTEWTIDRFRTCLRLPVYRQTLFVILYKFRFLLGQYYYVVYYRAMHSAHYDVASCHSFIHSFIHWSQFVERMSRMPNAEQWYLLKVTGHWCRVSVCSSVRHTRPVCRNG